MRRDDWVTPTLDDFVSTVAAHRFSLCTSPRWRTGSYTRSVDVALIVPVKAFSHAKQRLESALSPAERASLAQWTAGRVVRSFDLACVYVVCDDPVVSDWAQHLGASVLWTAQRGLNGAVSDGVAAITAAGFDHAIICHADLALPDGLADVVRPGYATLVPDRRRDGTNVMAFPTSTPIGASYGPGSFQRHLRAAQGQRHEVRADPLLAIDLDDVTDLSHPLVRKVLPAWMPTIPASRP